MAHESFKKVLDRLDFTIVDNIRPYLGIDNLEIILKYLLNKRDEEYKHINMTILRCILWHLNFIIENNFKFNNDGIKVEYIRFRKQLINWYIQCNTQDENGNDVVDIIEYSYLITYK